MGLLIPAKIDIYVHSVSDESIALILDKLTSIEGKVNAMTAEFQAVIKRIDDASNAIAARLDNLATQISGGLSADEAAPIVASLQAEADRLEVLGRDPNNPVPPAVTNPPA